MSTRWSRALDRSLFSCSGQGWPRGGLPNARHSGASDPGAGPGDDEPSTLRCHGAGASNSTSARQLLNDAGPAGIGESSAEPRSPFDVSSSSTIPARLVDVRRLGLESVVALALLGLLAELNWQFSGQTLAATGQQRATRRAVDADVGDRRGAASQRHHLPVSGRTSSPSRPRWTSPRRAAQRRFPRARSGPLHRRPENTMLDVRQAVTEGRRTSR